MEDRPEIATWRELLKKLIEDPHEKERIAKAARVRQSTLERWAKGTSRPHKENMRLLLKALSPAVLPSFVRLIADDFPGLTQANALDKQVQAEFPSEFHEQIGRAHAKLPLPIHRQVLQDLIFQQAIKHLDPDRRGMLISIACFVRPFDGLKVRSLREIGGIGTPPWEFDPAQKMMLFGAESLAGYAVARLGRVIVPNRHDPISFPVHWTEHEQSALAVPIMRRGRIAGCLLTTSTVPDYFLPGNPPSLILESYTYLAALQFDEEEFFDPSEIALGYMPSYEQQAPYFRDFNQLVLQRLRLAQTRRGYFTLEEAQRQVWREIEEQLLQAFLQIESNK